MNTDDKAARTVDGWMSTINAVKEAGGTSCYVTDPELISWHWVETEARNRGLHAARAPTAMARNRVRIAWSA